MTNNAAGDSSEQDWRLQAELDVEDTHRTLDRLLGHLRGPDVFKDIEAAVAHDVVVTHDGKLVFAYAASEAAILAARRAIEDALRQDSIAASVRLSHWDGEKESWRQTDPPLSDDEQLAEASSESAAETIETRTMVARSGKLVRAEFEQTMLSWAGKLGLECKLVEHPHLLTTQIAFTATGPRGKIDEFSRGLVAEGWAMVRTEESWTVGL